MRRNKLFTKLASGALVVAVASGAVLLTGAVAGAAPPAGTLGNLTITPAVGSDLTAATARTSGACPTTADSANMLITGPVGAADPTFPANNPFPIVTTSKASFSTTDPFDLPFRLNLKDAATDRGKTLQTGEYHLIAQCIKGLTQELFGTFTGAIFFTSPTAYQTTDPNAGPTATTTTLNVTPASPAAAGTVETLTATVSPAAAGTIQFKDGNTNIGAAVSVSGGTATTTTTLSSGSHPLTAVFTPTNPAAFGSSTSQTVTFVVNATPGATTTTTTLSATPSGTVTQGTSVVLNGTVSPATAAGTIQFKDGNTNIGAPAPVTNGTATTTTSTLGVGTHQLTANFVPTNSTAFGPSSSQPVTLTVTTQTPGGGSSTATETITTTIAAGSLAISVGNTSVTLPSPQLNPESTLLVTAGRINAITVTDTRAGNPGWTVSGQVTDFSDGGSHAINGANLGWVPNVIDKSANQTVTPGDTVTPANGIAPGATPPAGVGLAVSRTLATAATLAGLGTAHLDALLNLFAPTSTTAGTYTATLTLTAI